MRTTTLAIIGIVLLLIVGGAGYWFQNRPAVPPTEAQWKRLRVYSILVGIADGMVCPHNMVTRRMKVEEAKKGLARLRARYALSPAQTKELDGSAAIDREIGFGDGHVNIEKCNKVGPRYLDYFVIKMARE